MTDTHRWDWSSGEKQIHVAEWNDRFEWVEELYASPDGEQVAAIVNQAEGEFNVCINGETWENPLEKIWHLRFTPDNRPVALVSDAGEWTVAVAGELWENRFGYVWNLCFNPDGKAIGISFQQDMKYGLAINDVPWETTFLHATDPVLSEDGRHGAASVQVVATGEAEIRKFQEGTITAAVDGVAWDSVFVNVWGKNFNPDATRLAAEVRVTLYDYTIAVDGTAWEKTFSGVWEPVFHPFTQAVLAPVRIQGKWTLAQNAEILWKNRYFQLWHPVFSPDGARLAAIVSPSFGKWTVAVDDVPWSYTAGELVTDVTFSPDGARIGGIIKDNGNWSIVVDGKPWRSTFDMVWKPVFSPDGSQVAVKMEKDGKIGFALNDRMLNFSCENAWPPVFSPDGGRLLLRTVENGVYYRRVIPLTDLG